MRLFDLHCDTLTECEHKQMSLVSNSLHWDLTRARTFFDNVYQIAAIYISDDIQQKDAWDYVLRILFYLEKQSVTVIKSAFDLQQSTHGVLLAVENGRAIGCDLSKISTLASLGFVYVTLTWNGSNAIGNGCFSGCSDGLTDFGKLAVQEMFRVGVLPDTSHLNSAGFWDVVDIAKGRPFLASHSVSDAVCSHPRNLDDKQFCAIQKSGGLVGLNLCQDQLGAQNFEQLERHLVHFWELDGLNTVALGMDLDGTDLPPEWNGIEVGVRLYEYFLNRQYPEDLIDRLFLKNSYAFFMKTLTSREKCIRIGT